ncbi:MAG: hypothetical protein KY467_13035 [Gemmatimonadetes bacterium]|nr:hypothetical protein [Gemmatimonadota bacterium]
MATRSLRAPDGTVWEVWDVQPGLQLESRPGRSVLLPDEMAAGWLCFDSAGEKRRLYPIPSCWDECADADLLQMCRDARPVRADRIPSF